ncbi:short chain dehydrogenase [Echria macrotheca]|uniref:Short chain dehydrogenase n=1 Tax=Echria macrotheca TaxID=438768 RepID=A0AAJ0B298_9PEZI|nr:short chain dehydrogenase [Echria macrotheca]
MAKPVVLVTGANTGIGFEAVKAFAASPNPYHIIVGSRSVEKGEAAIQQIKAEYPDSSTTLELVQVDVTSDDSINAAFEAVSSKHEYIDALVNNAGAVFDHWLGNNAGSVRDTFNKAWDVNVAGTHVMTYVFAPLLIKSPNTPRLVFITSGLSTLQGAAENLVPPAHQRTITPGWPKEGGILPMGYRSSKAGMNMMMLGWHHMLAVDGVKTLCLSPGFLATGLGGDQKRLEKMGAGPASLGGTFIKDVVDGQRDADVGKVIRRDGVQPW